MRNHLHVLRRHVFGPFILLWVGISVISLAWAAATPLGGSPDEPAHIIKAAAVVRGQFVGEPTSEPAVTRVMVPVGIATAASWPSCFAFKPAEDASCMPLIGNGLSLDRATTSAGLYNPVYYAAVGWPSVFIENSRLSAYSMRAVSAVLASFFLAVAGAALLRNRSAPIAGFTILAVLTPMVFFLNGSVNPNSLEVSAGVALLTLIVITVRDERREWRLGLLLPLIAIAGFFLANARGLSPLWMALIAVAALVASTRPRLRQLLATPSVWVTIVILGASAAGALAWTVSTGSLSKMGTFPGAGTVTPESSFVTMLLEYSFDPGLVAYFGWLDTLPSSVVFVVWSSLAVGIVGLALVFSSGRLRLAVIVLIAGYFLIPAFAQAGSIVQSGFIWQGRYTLVAYVCVVATAGFGLAATRPPLRMIRNQKTVAIALVAASVGVMQLFSLVANIRRNAVGLDSTWTSFLTDPPNWTPPGGIYLWPAIAAIGFVIILAAWVPLPRAKVDGTHPRFELARSESARVDRSRIGRR